MAIINNPPIDDFPGDGGSPPVAITTLELSTGNVGTSYIQYLDATAGYPPYTWSITLGSLPPGLTLTSNGIISGTPTTIGSYTFTIKVTDQIGGTDVKSFYIQIDDTTGPIITTTSLPAILVGNPYNEIVEANGGTTPYVDWSVIVGSLPTGLSLNSTTGEITGTPTVPGNYPFTIEVTDSNALTDIQAFTIVIQAINPTITTTGLPDTISGTLYSADIFATGGTTPYVTWEISVGDLPPGFSLIGGVSSASISGTSTTVGNYSFTVKLTDSLGGFDTQSLSITIYDGAYPIVSTTTLPDGQIGSAYSSILQAVGGSLPYVWELDTGYLPPGLDLDSDSGIISGIPTANGAYIFTIKATDYNGNSDTQILSIIVGNYTLPAITTDRLPNTIVNTTYSSYVQAIGGDMPYEWSLVSPLPSGLFLNSQTGLISGISDTVGIYTFEILVKDISDNIDIREFTIQVGESTSPLIITTCIPFADRTIFYNQQLIVQGGVPSYEWSISSGILPDGLTLSATGIISGIPTTIGVYDFTIAVKDSSTGLDTEDYRIIVKSPGYDSRCCICVFTNDIIEFSHNSVNGDLKATGGTVLSNTKWQAPSVEGFYEVSITAEGVNGIISVSNTINVVKRLEVINSSDFINHLLPGDSFYLKTNYPIDMVTWQTLNSEYPIITSDGHVFINSNPADKCFGALECTVRATLNPIDNCNIQSHVDVKIQVNPVYPTPDNCGPYISKWLREVKDFKVIVTEFEGGCDETHIKNKVPTIRWSITYEGLINHRQDNSICPNCANIINSSDCCITQSFGNINTDECNQLLRTSNRLDDFWNLVYGQYKSFTLIDHDTGEIWYNVRFSDNMSIDHRHRRSSTNRTSKLVWKPCCNKSPAGGTCSKHGMISYKPNYRKGNKTACQVTDNIVITTYGNRAFHSTYLTWSSTGSTPIAGYQLRINGDVFENFVMDVGNVTTYIHNYLKSGTTYLYEVRAYDYDRNYSSWSAPIYAKTLVEHIIPENGLVFDDQELTFGKQGIVF